ncbi:uncharacterized protein LOC125200478 [Salvia hispanica]|uniref:uncharacterized protein LOC125200478 n=1 Tax=Salvia hispanica TaxID=49212 RepID=UPI002009173A|nr:uncharacterized protein LOC125200478 [Salvia hispanica]
MEVLRLLKQNLTKAQQRMHRSANLHRWDIEFAVDDLVLLKLRQYRQHSVARPLAAKLARRFYGPFRVLERIGPVAYRLELPEGSKIHNVFHVSLLRPFVHESSQLIPATLPMDFSASHPLVRSVRVLERRSVFRNGVVEDQGLVEWDDGVPDKPSWEPMEVISKRFPYLLEDKESLKPRGVDTSTLEPPQEEVEEKEMPEEISDVASQPVTDEPIAHRTRKRRQKPKHLEDYV